nr:PREDICTED: uncharacterized protein LOC102350446 [Latimeria chalumnae]|eukprot:XP_014344463.1 PREDICTED: uncharacterized protein LOC102350446 [Latimeria chalumnae]
MNYVSIDRGLGNELQQSVGPLEKDDGSSVTLEYRGLGNELKQSVEPQEKEYGSSVKLECTYKTSYTYYFLFWYKLNTDKSLQFISRYNSYDSTSYTDASYQDRFTNRGFGNEVKQSVHSQKKEDGSSVILECTYKTSYTSYYFFWYKLNPDKALQFISRYHNYGSASKVRSKDVLFQDKELIGVEGQNVTVECNYTESIQYLFWYRQMQHGKLEYILGRNEYSYKDNAEGFGSFSANVNKNDGTLKMFHLVITGVQVTDSAVNIIVVSHHCFPYNILFFPMTDKGLGNEVKQSTVPLEKDYGSSVTLESTYNRGHGNEVQQSARSMEKVYGSSVKLEYRGLGNEVQQSIVPLEKDYGSSVTLESTYSTSYTDYYLYWYKLNPDKTFQYISRYRNSWSSNGVFGDSIEQPDSEIPGKEGEAVTVKCTFSGGGSYVYWYRQYPNQAFQYILWKGVGSYSGENTADFAKGKFSMSTERGSVYGDSVEQPDVELSVKEGESIALKCTFPSGSGYVFWYRKYPNQALQYILQQGVGDEVFGDSVQQDQSAHSQKEGDSVTLTCTYSTTENYVYLYWYRKNRNGALEYILYRGAKSRSGYDHTAEFAKDKFDSRADSSTTTLTIKTVQLSDAALYYCALRIDSTVLEILLPAVQKPQSSKPHHLKYTPHPPFSSGLLGDSIQSQELAVPSKEGDTVTLVCTHSTSSSNIWLHWYRKFPNEAPEFILSRGAKSASGDDYTADFAKDKCEAGKEAESNEVLSEGHLELSSVLVIEMQYLEIQSNRTNQNIQKKRGFLCPSPVPILPVVPTFTCTGITAIQTELLSIFSREEPSQEVIHSRNTHILQGIFEKVIRFKRTTRSL